MSFEQSAESNVWQLLQDGERVAFLGTYVDDLIAVGPEFVREMLGQIGRFWTEPEILVSCFLVYRVLHSFILVSLIGDCDHLSRANFLDSLAN